MATESLAAKLERLEAENAALRAKQGGTGELTFRVSDAGAVSVYGNGRWPTTLYREQWERLIAKVPALTAFIAANAADLKGKDESETAYAVRFPDKAVRRAAAKAKAAL